MSSAVGAGALMAGKVVVVSGVGPGLGQAVARTMAREGAAVVLAARDAARLADVRHQIEADGGTALDVPTNIVDPGACHALVEAAVDRFGRLDTLVNSAFRPDPGLPFADADLAQWRKIHEVNVWGTLQLTQAAVPALREACGNIVFVSSMVVRKAMPLQGAYATSKGALLVAARVLARELAPEIRVNSVVPGWMWGPSVQVYVDWMVAEEGITEEEAKARIASEIPLGRIPPQEDCAEAVVFLASDRAASSTGQTLDVNGGEVLT